jgi:hypothetical protein
MSESTPSGPAPVATELSKTYEPQSVESRWYDIWEKAGYFQPAKEGKPEFLKGNIRVTTLQNQQETIDAGGLVLTKHPVFIELVE